MTEPRFPNEPPGYRAARDELLAAEVELRAQTEKVAALRRALPLGGEVTEDYAFTERREGSERLVTLSELFGDKDTLFVYGFMFGPEVEQPCPLCISILDALEGSVVHLEQRIAVAVSAKAPLPKLTEFADRRGWRRLRLVSSSDNTFQRDYLAESPDGGQLPMANVFVKRDGRVHHFWGSELLFEDFPDGDARHMDIAWPLWNVLDFTPAGRGDFYPRVRYDG